MIEISDLSRSFGYLKAVDNISFAVHTGEIVGFLGPNGAGKTTTMRMMVGYLQPGSGSIELDGESIYKDPMRTSTKIGYLAEHNPLYDDMCVGEFLEYIASLRRMPSALFRERLAFVTQKCGLHSVLRQKIGTLSKGYRQRAGLAQAILHDPEVLILDEPTSGLDPNQIIEIRDLIRELGAEKTVLLSSHIMQEVQALCDRVIIISNGRIIVDDRKENLPSYMGTRQTLVLEVEADAPDFTDWLDQHKDVTLVDMTRQDGVCNVRFDVPGGVDLRRELSAFVADQGWPILGIMSEKHSLEDIFHTLTTAEQLPDTASPPSVPQDHDLAELPDEAIKIIADYGKIPDDLATIAPDPSEPNEQEPPLSEGSQLKEESSAAEETEAEERT